jgi:hypothetical protein
MSGITMVLKNGRNNHKDIHEYPSMVIDTLNEYRTKINFETMFNAYTEKSLMEMWSNDVYRYFGLTWHSDSGGLQIITTGAKITEELKEQVYEKQALYSTYAMCFDELPIRVTSYGGTSSRVDLSNRQYIVEQAEECGKKTGLNIKKQIETIRKLNSKTKVFLICQGNKRQDFVDYYNNIMSVIPEDYYSNLAGVALSAACTGLGHLEAIEMLSSYRFMKIPEGMGKKLHVLGFGSLKRLIPLLLLKISGYIDADITFDTSSHAMSCLLGETTIWDETNRKGVKHTLGKVRSKKSDKVFLHFFNKYKKIIQKYYPDMSEDDYLNIVANDLTTSDKYNLDCRKSVIINFYTRFLLAYESFLSFANAMIEQLDEFEKNIVDTGFGYYDALIKVKTEEDYFIWYEKYSRHTNTNPIESFKTLKEAIEGKPTLERFFGV